MTSALDPSLRAMRSKYILSLHEEIRDSGCRNSEQANQVPYAKRNPTIIESIANVDAIPAFALGLSQKQSEALYVN